jgi:molybdopterin-containing oxidoreductase family iron-sulfur binding subunit
MISRRRLIFGLGFLALSIVSEEIVSKVLGSFQKPSNNPRWGLVVDVLKFNELGYGKMQEIVNACRIEHNIPVIEGKDRIEWIWLIELSRVFPENVFESNFGLLIPVMCNQCDNPPCVKVCPTRATFRRMDGIVQQDYHRCIGCRYCIAACPYDARSFNWRDPRPYIDPLNENYPTRTIGVVEKCNFCAERIDEGLKPVCVEKSEGTFLFGDLNKLESEISKLLRENVFLRRKDHLGTEPKVYYLL